MFKIRYINLQTLQQGQSNFQQIFILLRKILIKVADLSSSLVTKAYIFRVGWDKLGAIFLYVNRSIFENSVLRVKKFLA